MIPPKNLIALIGFALVVNVTQAAPGTWSATPTSSNWVTATNWLDGVIPGSSGDVTNLGNTDIATFSEASSTNYISLGSARSLGGFLFDTANASAYTIDDRSGSRFFLTRGMTSQVTSTVTNSQVISARIWIAAGISGISNNYTFRNDAASSETTFRLSGSITNSSLTNGTALILAGSNTGSNRVSAVIAETNSSTFILTKEETGTWILNASNTYTGGTVINNGLLAITDNNALGTGPVTINGGTLANSSGSGKTIANNVVFGGDAALGGAPGGASLTFNGTTDLGGATRALSMSNSITFAGTVSNGDLVVLASSNNRRLTFVSASNSFGALTINGGILQVGNGGTTGTLTNVAVTNNATQLAINRSDDITQGAVYPGGAIFGGFALVQLGTGTLTLDAANAFSGATIISNGTLQIGAGATAGALATNSAITLATNTATLAFNRSDNLTQGVDFSSDGIDGPGAMVKLGAGTLTLNAANTYTGNTTISNGTLLLATNGSLTFKIEDSGTNNALLGSGTTVIAGSFVFDLSSASTNTNATWTIVSNSLANTYGTNFFVSGFSGVAGGNWTNTTNGVNYVFAQSNGVLSVQEAAVDNYASWVSYWQGVDAGFTNTAGTANPDGDPFDNNLEFAFDGNPTVGTPALLAATKVGTNSVFNYVARKDPPGGVTYQVQSTTNLATGPWITNAVTVSNAANQSGLNIPADYERKEFVVPAAAGNFFRVRAILAP